VNVRLGDAAVVRFDALPDLTFQARVIERAQAADPHSGVFAVKLGIDGAYDRQGHPAAATGDDPLADGLIGTAEITTSGTPGKRSYVPLNALVEGDQEHATLFLLDPAGTVVHENKVAVAFVAGERVALTRPLPAGSRVVTDGAAYLSDGDAVRVVP
jgi:hypothetical protein